MEESRWVQEIYGVQFKKTQLMSRGGGVTGRCPGWCAGNGIMTKLGIPAGDEERLFTPGVYLWESSFQTPVVPHQTHL